MRDVPCGLAPPLEILVPGSTSNLGPGFDLLGLALTLPLTVRVHDGGEGPSGIGEAGGEAAGWPREAGQNLLLLAFERAFRELGGEGAFRFEVDSRIPVGRGLGSSGAAVAAGLLLGAALAPRACSRSELLAFGAELEGHPDNVAASLFGGCVLCHPAPGGARGGLPLVVRLELADAISCAVAWPRKPLATARARAVLPAQVSHEDAVENARRLGLLLEGLRSADPELLTQGGEDRLHVPYRLELLPGARAALDAARSSGAWLATISGSGSGLVALGPEARIGAIAEAMAEALREATGSGTGRALDPWREAPRVRRAPG